VRQGHPLRPPCSGLLYSASFVMCSSSGLPPSPLRICSARPGLAGACHRLRGASALPGVLALVVPWFRRCRPRLQGVPRVKGLV